jgi:D-alanyl-D-alanine-carboxypeptidase/D-alanyl-D-alanine-endopeptidase
MRTRVMMLLFAFAVPLMAADAPSDADIRKELVERIDVQKQGVGIVVGLIDARGRRIVAYGPTAIGSGQAVTGDTIFEIGSMTKLFTVLALADMVQKGEVALTDPVAKLLPSTVKMPSRDGKVITLEDLATHTSGLPRLPTNLAPKDVNNPYADYTPAELYAFLSSYELPRDIGSHYEYSNLGAGLLGHALALRAGVDYETHIRSRILDPLGMKSTSIRLAEPATARLAKGYDGNLKPAANWDFSTLAGAGALRSTANDLLTFLSAAIGLTKTPLSNAMTAMTSVRRKTDSPNLEIALGWHISNDRRARNRVAQRRHGRLSLVHGLRPRAALRRRRTFECVDTDGRRRHRSASACTLKGASRSEARCGAAGTIRRQLSARAAVRPDCDA